MLSHSIHLHNNAVHPVGAHGYTILASAKQHASTPRMVVKHWPHHAPTIPKPISLTRTQCASPQASASEALSTAAPAKPPQKTLLCTSVTAPTPALALEEVKQAKAAGADIAELRLDYLEEFDPETDLQVLIEESVLPVIITLRPTWEGGNFAGPEAIRLSVLKFAAVLGAPYVDVEFEAAYAFYAGGGASLPVDTKIIISNHDYEKTPSYDELCTRARNMRDAGADIVKIACMANDVTDCMTIFKLLASRESDLIAIAMGERGQPTRLLAPKFGSYLTFGALQADKASAPGQTTLEQLRDLYRLPTQGPETQVYGIVGNPVSHSRSPLLHNTAFGAAGVDAVYVPFLVDDMQRFLTGFDLWDFAGYSVTIPHKEAALAGASEVDPVAQQIGAVNTLVRQPDGGLRGYNTDWQAAISAIEHAYAVQKNTTPQQTTSTEGAAGEGEPPSGAGEGPGSPLEGCTVVVLGAGGAGRALAFGAAHRGAKVLIANRNRARSEQLVAEMGPSVATVVDWEAVLEGNVCGDVLANTTSVGMAPNDDVSPVPAAALGGFAVVFDAVYTPLETKLLKEAAAAGCGTVTGLEMFVGQAAEQFELFTGKPADVELMRTTVLKSL